MEKKENVATAILRTPYSVRYKYEDRATCLAWPGAGSPGLSAGDSVDEWTGCALWSAVLRLSFAGLHFSALPVLSVALRAQARAARAQQKRDEKRERPYLTEYDVRRTGPITSRCLSTKRDDSVAVVKICNGAEPALASGPTENAPDRNNVCWTMGGWAADCGKRARFR